MNDIGILLYWCQDMTPMVLADMCTMLVKLGALGVELRHNKNFNTGVDPDAHTRASSILLLNFIEPR